MKTKEESQREYDEMSKYIQSCMAIKDHSKERFIPTKRVAVDGRVWWVVWDRERKCYSPYLCHGKYKTKWDCQFYIYLYNKLWESYFQKLY